MSIVCRPGLFVPALVTVMSVGGAWSAAAVAAPPTPEDALALRPRQKGVDYSQPTADEAKQCTIKQEKEGGSSALVVRGPSGEVLRAFADTDGNRVVDRWSYYKDGLEVYREIDADKDTKPEEYRWLGAAGSRWGLDTNADGQIDSWKVLSAEESTAEIVAALRDRDAAVFARLLPGKEDLQAAGFEGELLADILARTAAAPAAFAKVAADQKEVVADSRWTSMLTPQAPGTLPAGMAGLTKDVVAHDNVVALVEGKQGNGQVFVGSLVKCGEVWRPVEAPQVSGGLADAFSFFAPRLPARGPAAGSGDVAENLQPLLASLREIEGKMATADAAGRKTLAAQQVGLLEQLAAGAAETDKTFWTNQVVETIAAYAQEGLYPDGIAKLEQLAEAATGDEATSAFIAFRLIQARFARGMEPGDADREAVQKAWFDDLAAFAETYPKAPDSAEALLQLAFRDEFSEGDSGVASAIKRYSTIVTNFPDTAQARKAAGAVRRLESVGKPFALTGPTFEGKQVSVASAKGVPVLVHYWSTDCEPCKVDIAQIRELQAKYGAKKFAVLGVSLDGDKAKLVRFLQAKPLPWPQVYEPGGLDSRLAEEFGVQALPTMVLVGPDGLVVNRNVAIASLEKELDALIGGAGK